MHSNLQTIKRKSIDSILNIILKNGDTLNQNALDRLLNNCKQEIMVVVNAAMKIAYLDGHSNGYNEGFDDCKHGRDQRIYNVHLN